MANFGLSEIRQLVETLEGSSLAELQVESGDFKLLLKKAGPAPVQMAPQAPVQAPAPAAPAPQAPAPARGGATIDAPAVGVFYRAPSPESPPFVDVGDSVRPGQVVGILEAMKIMNEVNAEAGGRVARVLVRDGEAVEYGQALFELEPD